MVRGVGAGLVPPEAVRLPDALVGGGPDMSGPYVRIATCGLDSPGPDVDMTTRWSGGVGAGLVPPGAVRLPDGFASRGPDMSGPYIRIMQPVR